MNELYVERVLAMRPDRAAFSHASGDELELNKLLVKELTPLLKQSQFNPNHDIDKVDLLQLAYGICLQVYESPEIDDESNSVVWLTINDFIESIRIYSTSNEQSSMALCLALHILSLQREISAKARKFADLMKVYCAQTALDSRLYNYFYSLRTETSKQYKVDWTTSFNPDIDNLSALSHSTWNTITHGFSLEMVESWLGRIGSKRYKLLKVITNAFEEDVRQRKITEEQNDNFDW